MADLLAIGDWASARLMLPADALDDVAFDLRYGPIDRLSLLLLDARPDGDGFSLVLGAVGNDTVQNRTTVSCLRWYADSNAVDIFDEIVLNTYEGVLFSPEALRNDSEEDTKHRAGCSLQ